MPATVASALTPSRSTLGKPDGIDAAISELIAEGINAVQISRLAKRSSASRASFYRCFSSRQAQLDAVLERWHTVNSKLIDNVLINVTSLSTGVVELFSQRVGNYRFSAEFKRLVRAWARLDNAVLATVREEGHNRIRSTGKNFKGVGCMHQKALARARVW